MIKKAWLIVEGETGEFMPDARIRVMLDNRHRIIAYPAGKMRKFRIRSTVGDWIHARLTPCDLTKGRITSRVRTHGQGPGRRRGGSWANPQTIGAIDDQGTEKIEPRGAQAESAEAQDERLPAKPEAGPRIASPARQVKNRSANGTLKAAGRRPAWLETAGKSQFLRTQRNSFASNHRGGDRQREELRVASEEECRFEIFRKDEERMTSTLFSGGDWRWRLVTTGGLILAEASGYPSETTCRAAVAVLQKRAATAPVIAGSGEQR